ncbi:hypothetical protein EVG20_g1925 [Dentipellis fragilis]|uniref:RlpA-like protein double-psi beta-barrel domain-containing protein n=1 Tax=Dentipellis fragilis TaxID=205917 RepID=A0A4Y9ZB89_9AGAM|nr:hypothetical protein EVG20_g1925 [Dentipellis fragilis]
MLLTLLFLLGATVAAPLPSVELDKRTTHSGRATWFTPGLGNCGYTDNESDPVIAVSKSFYDQNGGGNCNQWIQIKNTANGKTAYGHVRDSCPGCGEYDLDLSPSVFKQLGSLDTGVLPISWHFEAKGWSP